MSEILSEKVVEELCRVADRLFEYGNLVKDEADMAVKIAKELREKIAGLEGALRDAKAHIGRLQRSGWKAYHEGERAFRYWKDRNAERQRLRDKVVDLEDEIDELKDKLEARSATPEAPEAETARLSLEFAKRFGLEVVCARYEDNDGSITTVHSTSGHKFRAGYGSRCIKPSINEPLTVDVVLEVLADQEPPLFAKVFHQVGGLQKYGAKILTEAGRMLGYGVGNIPFLALLRALDAAGVMGEEVKGE